MIQQCTGRIRSTPVNFRCKFFCVDIPYSGKNPYSFREGLKITVVKCYPQRRSKLQRSIFSRQFSLKLETLDFSKSLLGFAVNLVH